MLDSIINRMAERPILTCMWLLPACVVVGHVMAAVLS